MISLCMPTIRPGGIDLFVNSFIGMEREDFELIVIDDSPNRFERGTVPKYLESKGITNFVYSKSKPKQYLDSFCGLANAMNTAVILASGDYIVFLSDYSFLPNGWLQSWENIRLHYGDKTLVSGGGIVYACPKPPNPGDINTWEGTDLTWNCIVPIFPWVAKEFETFYFGAPLQFLLDTNGVDERADYDHTWSLASQVWQAKKLGYNLEVVQNVCCHIVDHRSWDSENEPNPNGRDGLWRMKGYSIEQPQWEVPSKNMFDIKELRRQIGNF